MQKNLFRRLIIAGMIISVNWVQAQNPQERAPEKTTSGGAAFNKIGFVGDRVDTLRVNSELKASQEARRSGKTWRWIWSSVTVAGVVAVAAIVLSKSDRENSENKIEDLPVPPERP